MRTYLSRSHRAKDGAVEVEGQWAGVQWIALGLLAVLPVVARSPLGLGVASIGAVVLYLFPARRRVLFDPERRAVIIDHAGFFRESGSRAIRFDDLRRLVFQPAGRKGGKPLFAAYARTQAGRVYLFSHAGERETALLERDLARVLDR